MKLPTIARPYADKFQQANKIGNWTFTQFLYVLEKLRILHYWEFLGG